MDEPPLPYEMEDELLSPKVRRPAKRQKALTLDQILADRSLDLWKFTHSGLPSSSVLKGYNSDDEEDNSRCNKERMFCKIVDDCGKKVHEISSEDDNPSWGLTVFGQQKPLPLSNSSRLATSKLLEPFTKKELNLLLDMKVEKGESFLEELIKNGWLLKLSFACGFIEDSIASWTFYQMLYSSNKELQDAACNFLCTVLLCEKEANKPSVKLRWFPEFSELKNALGVYGYLSGSSSNNCSSVSKLDQTGSGHEGPPLNIRSWVKLLSACCQIRNIRPIFSTSEAEEFLCVIIRFHLDRKLQGLSGILCECLQSVIGYFMESEWSTSCKMVADFISQSIPLDYNCLRIVDCIFGDDIRCKQLRSQVAFQMLLNCFDNRVGDGTDILKLISINVKDKSCDFFKIYIYLCLAETWLTYQSIDGRPKLLKTWRKYLHSCAKQIVPTDLRSYASKVRNKASYIYQITAEKSDSD